MRIQLIGKKSQEVRNQQLAQMPEGERGAAAATGEPSTTLLVGLICANAGHAISVPRAKAAPRRKFVLRYPTLAYQHQQPSHIHTSGGNQCSVAFPVRQRVSIRTAIAEENVRPLDREKPYQRWRSSRRPRRSA